MPLTGCEMCLRHADNGDVLGDRSPAQRNNSPATCSHHALTRCRQFRCYDNQLLLREYFLPVTSADVMTINYFTVSTF